MSNNKPIKPGDVVRSLDGKLAPVRGTVVRVEPATKRQNAWGAASVVPEQVFVLWGSTSW